MSDYRKLEVWDDSCLFAKAVYGAFSECRDYGLKDQVTGSAVSIASNIAEGSDRDSDVEFMRFLRIAKASCAECRTQLRIASMIDCITKEQFEKLEREAESINKRIGSLIRYLNSAN